jgi:hypothetical protein
MFVALVIQHVKRMHLAIWSSVARLDVTFFPLYLTKGMILKKIIGHKMCVSIPLQLLPETLLTLRRTSQTLPYVYFGLHIKYLLFLSGF